MVSLLASIIPVLSRKILLSAKWRSPSKGRTKKLNNCKTQLRHSKAELMICRKNWNKKEIKMTSRRPNSFPKKSSKYGTNASRRPNSFPKKSSKYYGRPKRRKNSTSMKGDCWQWMWLSTTNSKHYNSKIIIWLRSICATISTSLILVSVAINSNTSNSAKTHK